MTFKRIFNLFAFTLAVMALASSCNKDDDMTTDCINGEGTITTTTLSVADFTGIDLAFSSNVTINQGSPQKVEATGHPNIIEKITTDVSNNIWVIGLEDGCFEDYELSVEITVPNINSLELSGSGNLLVNDFSNQNAPLSLALSGSGNLTLNEFEGITDMNTTLNGSGDIITNNDITSLETLNLTISGSGKYSGFEINSNDCTVNSSGSGNAEIMVQNTLNVTISGSGNVSYKGMPTITQDISGSGSLIDAN